ncbi:uncharacterized protein [Parasteatoda tepidariorum]|uniref:uncharacterized protein n=1 Tax=Parasteatoda tepidariorum TaxID=114398 RepID=UPI001C71A962|nr:uncharacterized protein LOC107450658 [Parasteatoda tepidariorum]
MNVTTLNFKDMLSFNTWMDEESSRTYSSFKKDQGTQLHGKNSYSYYSCQFSRTAIKFHERKTSRKNIKGVLPTDVGCMARIICSENSGEINVLYFTKRNHALTEENIKFQPIKKTFRDYVKTNAQLGVPAARVIENIRGNRNLRGEDNIIIKESLLTNKNLKYYYDSVKSSSLLHREDAVAVHCLVNDMLQWPYNSALLHKPQFQEIVFGPSYQEINLPEDSFVVGIQMVQQKEMLVACGGKILCIDSTHKTNEQDFYLLNLLLQDEYGCGYAVAHFIISKLDKDMMTICFASIKDRIQDLQVNNIMTDDDKTTGPAFQAVFGDKVNHLLCKWHIHRAWNRKLNSSVSDAVLRQEIYAYLIVILEEPSISRFNQMIDDFKRRYIGKAPIFVNYFDNYCSKDRKPIWSMCHPQFPHANTDTNMYSESFRNELKTHYLKRKFNRRIDILINTLLKIEEDTYMGGGVTDHVNRHL